MAAMQEIEAAVGEADAQALPPPVGEPLVEQRPVEHDLVLGRERRRGQDAVAQFGERNRRGAAFADHHRSRGIGGAHGGLERRFHRQQHRHHRRDGVAGAGHVAHLDRIGRNMDRRSRRRPAASCRASLRVTSTASQPIDVRQFGGGGRNLVFGLPTGRCTAAASSLAFGVIRVAPR